MTNWQDLLALVIVAAAAVYLVRRMWHALRHGKSSCAQGCNGCPAAGGTSATVISIQPLPPR